MTRTTDAETQAAQRHLHRTADLRDAMPRLNGKTVTRWLRDEGWGELNAEQRDQLRRIFEFDDVAQLDTYLWDAYEVVKLVRMFDTDDYMLLGLAVMLPGCPTPAPRNKMGMKDGIRYWHTDSADYVYDKRPGKGGVLSINGEWFMTVGGGDAAGIRWVVDSHTTHGDDAVAVAAFIARGVKVRTTDCHGDWVIPRVLMDFADEGQPLTVAAIEERLEGNYQCYFQGEVQDALDHLVQTAQLVVRYEKA